MKAVLQHTALSFGLFIAGLSLIGCDQAETEISATQDMLTTEQKTTTPSSHESQIKTQQPAKSQGNVFYIVQDVADFQMKANQHVQQLQQTQNKIQNALDQQDVTNLKSAVEQLQQQLTGFNQSLQELNLKSQEIESIKTNVIQTNEQLLQTPLLNGEYDVSQVNVEQLKNQMGSIQNEMLKLAAMLLQDQSTTEMNTSIES